jgi:hypothetical protein
MQKQTYRYEQSAKEEEPVAGAAATGPARAEEPLGQRGGGGEDRQCAMDHPYDHEHS